jgi:imidazolonepropionase-like amidohydrolase
MLIVFRNGKIIDGTGKVIEKGTVAVNGKNLVFVGPTNKFRPSSKDTIFDLSGKTILPGLIDCHVHFCLDGSPDPVRSFSRESVPTTVLKAARYAELTLEAGVTTVRDQGGKDYIDIAIRDGIESAFIPGPRMICCGKQICMTGGHGWEFGREANGENDIRTAAREQLKAGANFIKMMATGGIMTKGVEPGSTQFTIEELRAGVQEAQKAGKRTASHAQGTEGIKNSLLAGIHSIEHGIFLDDEAIELMLERKAYLVPTLSVTYHILRGGTKRGVPAFAVEKARLAIKSHKQSVKKAYRAGVPIAFGTDAGTPFNEHGENLKELELLVATGFTPMEAIIAATKTASDVLGLEQMIGSLEKGKLADLIVVDGNPLEDIGLLQKKDKILVIMKDGHFFKCQVPKGGDGPSPGCRSQRYTV